MPTASDQMERNLAGLAEAGFRQADAPEVTQAQLPPAATALKSSPVRSFRIDPTRETVDVILDKATGDIVSWRKTPRTSADGVVHLCMTMAPRKADLNDVAVSVRSLVVDKFESAILGGIALRVDHAIKEAEELELVGRGLSLSPVTAERKSAMAGKRVLLLVHGIFSKTSAAFGGLGKGEADSALQKIYAGNVIAWDHFTLSKTTQQNAQDLAALLPANIKLDIVCHSRGAGVVRHLVEDPGIVKVLQDKGIRVGRVCFAAGACLGSPLATGDSADRLFRVLAQAMVLGGIATAPWAKALGLVIRAAVSGVQTFPGVLSMDPGGSMVRSLDGTATSAAQRYIYIRANFEADGLIKRFGDDVLIDRACFNDAPNDAVVPWSGAGASAGYATGLKDKENLLEFGTDGKSQGSVWHVNFFDQTSVQDLLIRELTPGW